MSEMKACPICGSRVKIHKNIAHAGQYGIVCMTCPLEMLHFPTRVELIEAWNTRPNDAKAMIAEGVKLLKPSDYVEVRTYLASPMGISLEDVEEVIKALGRVCEADTEQSSEGEEG